MLFNSIAYLIFLPTVVALFWLTPFKYRTALLTLASYIFYMSWKPVYGLLIFALTVGNFFIGARIDKRPARKKFWLVLGIAGNLLTLGYFKYTYMLHDTFNTALGWSGLKQLDPVPWMIILPLGISFFVFEFIHYLMEIYRGAKPVKSFLEFALFPSFFPTQIAGPIKRFQDFIPQLNKPQKITAVDFNEGVELVLFGLFKKVVLADTLAVVVNRCYSHTAILNGWDFWLATTAFAFQVYFDFSGYTDVARGSARLLGFKVPVNFKMPYLASSPSEFWRRWHISFCTWLRDYLYVPLGGSKGGTAMALRNILLTMALAGLWHGAAPHYIIWGTYMGLLVVLHRVWQLLYQPSEWITRIVATKAFHYFAIFLTFITYVAGLPIFRANDLHQALQIMGKMLGLAPQPAGDLAWLPSILATKDCILFPLLPALLIGLVIAQIAVRKFPGTPGVVPTLPLVKPVYLASLVVALLIFSPDIAPQFIYFQF